ncbi:lantibiotic dehydratase [Kribbella sp. NBC_01510]|uniref:lantibiotic dehydratase n=1 Tax=Kribbella sp. NBC_01510 TaxID=2903581 RepID=UPI00386D50C9
MTANSQPAEPLYRPLSWLAVRAPLLPAKTFRQIGAELDAWWSDPEIRFAVAVASPDLADALEAAPAVRLTAGAAQAALRRYLIRAATRPTPFGGFAAVGLANWADHTDLAIAPGRRPTRTRVDMGWLTEVAVRLAADPKCRPGLRVYANTCALERDGRVYLADLGTGGAHRGPDVSVRATSVVRLALKLARAGVTRDELARRIQARSDATPAKVERLLAQLAEQQFLLPELLPTLTADPLAHVVKGLDGVGNVPTAVEWSARLTTAASACRAVDDADPEAATGRIKALAAQLKDAAQLLPAPSGSGRQLVQVDSALPLSGTGVTRRIAADAGQAVDLLFRLHPNPTWAPLAGYRAAFHERYGDQRRVGLLELLDPRFGLGAPGDDLRHTHGALPVEVEDRRADVLRNLASTAIRDGCGEVVLDKRLLEQLSTWKPDPGQLPSSVELSAFVSARTRADLDHGEYLLFVGPNLGAQAAGRGIGRFADLLSPAANDLLAESAGAEDAAVGAGARTGPIVAELVYRPLPARSANVAVRPLVRGYELPIGVPPSLPPDRVVRVDELSVGLEDGRFRVWWDKAERPLLLAAGHMLNPAAAPPVCRAVMELTSDGRTHLPSFDWGPMTAMPFLPRVRHGRVVLSPARWRLGSTDLPTDRSAPKELDARLDEWRRRWRVPRLVYLVKGDHRLLLDLDEDTHRAELMEALRAADRRPLVLHEGVPGPDDAWLIGPHGEHLVELVVPLVRALSEQPRPAEGSHSPKAATWSNEQRRRPPGSEWLYLTLDGPRRTEDQLIAGSLGEMADGLVERGLADGWFFLRYADPQRQLRLRIHGEPGVLIDRVLPAVTRWGSEAIAAGTRACLQVLPYERELERYGGPETTAVCEAMACADSTAVRGLLGIARSVRRSSEFNLVELGLVSAADMLALLAGDDGATQSEWAKRLASAAREASDLFRERKLRMRALVRAAGDGSWGDAGEPWSENGDLVGEVLARRRAALAPLVSALRALWADGVGTQSPEQLAASIMHMHANRLGLDRADEQTTLGLLDRTLRSLLAYPPTSSHKHTSPS